jgi:hypothetical protein
MPRRKFCCLGIRSLQMLQPLEQHRRLAAYVRSGIQLAGLFINDCINVRSLCFCIINENTHSLPKRATSLTCSIQTACVYCCDCSVSWDDTSNHSSYPTNKARGNRLAATGTIAIAEAMASTPPIARGTPTIPMSSFRS